MTLQAILPKDLEESTIAGMKIGDIRYTLPWGIWVDENRCCWLNPDYPAEILSQGTAKMRIELCEDGFHVWPPPQETWKPTSEPRYLGTTGKYLPVARLR